VRRCDKNHGQTLKAQHSEFIIHHYILLLPNQTKPYLPSLQSVFSLFLSLSLSLTPTSDGCATVGDLEGGHSGLHWPKSFHLLHGAHATSGRLLRRFGSLWGSTRPPPPPPHRGGGDAASAAAGPAR